MIVANILKVRGKRFECLSGEEEEERR